MSGKGFEAVIEELLGGRLRPPSRKTIERHCDKLKDLHDIAMVSHCADLVKFEYPMATAQADIWEAPNDTHWIAAIMNSVDESFFKKRVLIHLSKISDKTAQAQAQRLIAACRGHGVDIFRFVVGVDHRQHPQRIQCCKRVAH